MSMSIQQLTIHRGPTVLGPHDAHFPAGQVSLITGASGAGKTSLCLALSGFITPTAGHITGTAAALVPQNPREWLNPRHRVDDVIAHAGACRGIDHGPARRQEIAWQARLPQHLLMRRCASLSGGQAARLCIARALATNLPAIVCDEPTAALDVSNAAGIAHLMLSLAEAGRVVIWATHDLDLAEAVTGRTHELRLEGISQA